MEFPFLDLCFVTDLCEVYGVACKIRQSARSMKVHRESLQHLHKNIELAWNNLLAFCPNAPTVNVSSSLRPSSPLRSIAFCDFLFVNFGDGDWRQAEAWNLLFAWGGWSKCGSWIDHPTFQLRGGRTTTELFPYFYHGNVAEFSRSIFDSCDALNLFTPCLLYPVFAIS